MIRQIDADVRIFAAVLCEHLQKAAAQRKAARGDVEDAALQAPVRGDLRLGSLNVFKGDGDVGEYFFPLRRQAYALRRAEEQRTVQLGFEPADDARDIRLGVIERGSGL